MKIDNKIYAIDITITAVMRPSIFGVTINSFFKNLFDDYLERGHRLHLIINIDPIGGEDSKYFIKCLGNYLNMESINIPIRASFPKAFKWVWSNVHVDADYVLHLEDDWELLRKVGLLRLINILEEEKDLALLRLPAFYAGTHVMKNWNKFFPYNGKYYECPEELKGGLGFCGHPSLIKAEFVRNTVKHLDDTRNPEKQFHSRGNTPIMEEVRRWRYGVYGVPGDPPLIRDIGRKWMVKNNFRKQGSKAHFINWEKVRIIKEKETNDRTV